LVQDDLANKNVSLANQHANKALAFVTDTVTKEIAERNPRLSDDLNAALATLRNSTTNPSMSSDVNSTVSDLDDILDEIVTARIDPEKSRNSTIQALRLVEILDGVLRNYGDAYAVGFDMTNMSMMMMMMGDGDGGMSMDMGTGGGDGGSNMSAGGMKTGMQVGEPTTESGPIGMQKQSESSMDNMSSMSMANMSSSQQYKLVNITDYQTAKILAQKAQELFNDRLVNTPISGTPEKVINDIVAAFQELNTSINEKAAPMDIMMIVHTKIHPNMIAAFGLQLGGST
jgi:phosphatidate phosphatase APP1